MKDINITDISGSVPLEAEFAMFNPTHEFIQNFYKINKSGIPMYYGEQGGWHVSFSFTAESINKSYQFLKIIR